MSPEDRLLTDITFMVDSIEPMDSVESGHIADASAWLCVTNDVFRRATAPTEPAKHLVSYFLLVDPVSGHILLGDHRKSGLWLPSGGHVEPGRTPPTPCVGSASRNWAWRHGSTRISGHARCSSP